MPSEEAVANFIDVTGAPPDHAASFLEMAGGSLEVAIQLYFNNMNGGGEDFGAMAVDGGAGQLEAAVPEWWGAVWPSTSAPPDAWTGQTLTGGADGWAGGISQPGNGPCGVLATVLGLVLAEGQHSRPQGEISVSADEIVPVLCQMLLRCRPNSDSPVVFVRPTQRGQYGPQDDLEFHHVTDGEAAVLAETQRRASDFQGPGGVIDLVYSAIFTRGVDLVKKEAVSEGGELPLVPKSFNCWVCSMELMSLLLRGTAHGNVGDFRADGERNTAWDGQCPLGVLSSSEVEQGVPVAQALKSPASPVWILHGGDHFTVAWAAAHPSAEAGSRFTLLHWNGLPPGGPRLAELSLEAVQGAVVGAEERPRFYKPSAGEVGEVIQADPEDKRNMPSEYRKWRYEVALARDDPDVSGDTAGPELPPEPKFNQDDPRYQKAGPWRCARCYDKRFQLPEFPGLVPEGECTCPRCNLPRAECGWSLWMPFKDLPAKRQRGLAGRHAKKIEPILWTKWPFAEVAASSGGLPDC